MRKTNLGALVVGLGCLGSTLAQPGTRNALVYGARAVGETEWHFGSYSLVSGDNRPLTFEIGVFTFRAQGVGMAQAVFKSYMDGVSTASGDSAAIIEDPSNGVPASGVDGRASVYNGSAQVQVVFTNRGAGVPGSGFRVSSAADTADASAAGGVSVKQSLPPWNPGFHSGDGDLTFRFNMTVACLSMGAARNFAVGTPLNRINTYTTYNTFDSNGTSEHKASTVVDWVNLTATWVPAPAGAAVIVFAGLIGARRRR